MVLVSQLPGFDAVVILAASKTLDYGESATITEENKDDYDEYEAADDVERILVGIFCATMEDAEQFDERHGKAKT